MIFNYILYLFTKLLRPGDSEKPFRSSNQLLPAHLSTAHSRGSTLSLIVAERQAEKQ